MLDSETKRRINTCRDILVGKVPDPKSQVEQITVALIYKFMDDMDLESEELGGARRFFTGDFERYRWSKLVAPGVSGQDMLNTYSEALAKMVENERLPALFRSIFRNAYLPYRDPETLRSFLREINSFTYDHSERLGDAFEYLLSVLGSQGDAGQFRTPRHIIDFMIEIIDPKKNEVVLDPACGTAGFLISAYKHILKANSTHVVNGNGKDEETDAAEQALESPMRFPGDLLTTEDRNRLARNIKGYDISPDMVRLSLVNLYLHGFADPKVEEYDTLTSEEKWTEMADVILANPPFMSPKGGIRPHTRFQVQSKRSEVLFIDYIAEHLSPQGRAAIIVPEGIIFQSQSAYAQLREMLVRNHLAAVISLPAGVFNPYSGVKTSILILDRTVAKANEYIAFFRIENDGFALGAQRKAQKGTQLPQVKAELTAWLETARLVDGEAFESSLGFAVARDQIAAGGEYNLSSERYREEDSKHFEIPRVPIVEICTLNPPKSELREMNPDTEVSFVPMAALNEWRIDFEPSETKRLSEVGNGYTYFADGDVLLAKVTPCFENGKAGIAKNLQSGIGFGSSEFYVLRPSEQVLPQWLYYCVTHEAFRSRAIPQMTGTGGLQRVPRTFVEQFEIPLPPLEAQREIVAEIEGYQRVIDGARTVIDNYRPHIPLDPDWPMVELADVIAALEAGVSVNSESRAVLQGEVGVLKTSAVTSGVFDPAEHKAILPEEVSRAKCNPKKGAIIISRMNTEALVGASAYVDRDHPELFLPDRLWQTIITRDDVNTQFVQLIISSDAYRAKISAVCGGTSGSMKNIAKSQFLAIKIPLPHLDVQQGIVTEVEAEKAIVDGNRALIARFEKKIEAAIAHVWDEGKTHGEEA
ncbi:N-6 DNA methylase [Mesorhizobium sp. M0902]|uniref:N-6 DNA methylase n=2 Tax=Mesorhizobium TaxID=68287 RepID=UPI00333A228F